MWTRGVKHGLRGATLAFALWVAALGAAAEPVVLEFSGWGAPSVEAIFERFNAEHDGIQIMLVPGGAAQILARMAAGTGPDLYRVSWAEFAPWMQQGLAVDLTPFIERDQEELQLEDIWPRALEPFQLNGRQYAMPHHIGGNLMYINIDRVDEAGLPLPRSDWDWDEFVAYAARLSLDRNNDGAMDVWGFVNPQMWAFSIAMIASEGVRFFDPNLPAFNVDTPAMHRAMQRIYDLVHIHRGAPGPGERPNAAEAWSSGSAAMTMQSANPSWSQVDFRFTVLPNPSGPAGRVMPGGPQPLAISPYSEHVEEAWTFIKWIVRPDIQAWISGELGLFPPARRSAIPFVDNPVLRIFGGELENQLVYTTVAHSTYERAFIQQMDAVLAHRQSIPAAAREIQLQMDNALAEAWK